MPQLDVVPFTSEVFFFGVTLYPFLILFVVQLSFVLYNNTFKNILLSGSFFSNKSAVSEQLFGVILVNFLKDYFSKVDYVISTLRESVLSYNNVICIFDNDKLVISEKFSIVDLLSLKILYFDHFVIYRLFSLHNFFQNVNLLHDDTVVTVRLHDFLKIYIRYFVLDLSTVFHTELTYFYTECTENISTFLINFKQRYIRNFVVFENGYLKNSKKLLLAYSISIISPSAYAVYLDLKATFLNVPGMLFLTVVSCYFFYRAYNTYPRVSAFVNKILFANRFFWTDANDKHFPDKKDKEKKNSSYFLFFSLNTFMEYFGDFLYCTSTISVNDKFLFPTLTFICGVFSNFVVFISIQILLQTLLLLGAIAMFTLGERKLMAAVQRRKGPNTGLPYGVAQPIADGIKLLLKEVIIPKKANTWLFLLAPIITFVLSLWQWIVIPFSAELQMVNFSSAVLYSLAISSLSVYGLIIAGWASNSKYAFLGAIRAAAQMISYEISLGFVILTILLLSSSMNYMVITLIQQTIWFVFPLFPCFILFCIIMLAETNRTPFDLSEAEAELVAGYNVEYSSMTFAFFFLGEYSNMMVMSCLTVIFFFGGWLPLWGMGSGSIIWFIVKVLIFCVFFVWVRATLPRYRYDQLMSIGWKIVLPFSMGFFLFINGLVIVFLDNFIANQNTLFTNQSYFTYIFLMC